ncbi:hypothetical protein PRIPAC_97968 [Pristionchus pacificus]|uniref:Uncharacterized protein n=1 Tax=Pristionchus pacificus TaxID=54126 RepID=A0A2A6BC88_PRIPA|nr:hypothetical protein PRIPAC_97968 [Pristionchus pacificus]|eukprot:PDM63495.1 hypothetical protein PRIPAC_53852 [Pristionchus pacificus]
MALLSLLCTGKDRVTRSMRIRKGCPIGRLCGSCEFCHEKDVLRTLGRAKTWFYFSRISCFALDKYKFQHGAVDLEMFAIKKKALHSRLLEGERTGRDIEKDQERGEEGGKEDKKRKPFSFFFGFVYRFVFNSSQIKFIENFSLDLSREQRRLPLL